MSERLQTIINELGINPVYVYEDLNQPSNLSGVYMIINKTTKDYYIGSKIVKLAIKKYELKNFAFVILDLYPNVVTKENNKELLDLEDKYLKLLVPNYNILTEAGSSFGYKHTEIDRQKMKDLYSDARREKIEKIREKALTRPPIPVYSTILEAANAINCNEKTIRRALQTEKKLVKRQ
ncbi:hypothetical protein GE21DRAFT_1329550 [Neurospora crassa]|nr:hypothetical protein GE21DRAFT_1329550 [Neurospora crassa]